jgi:uncharacterized protein (DUF1499 family)
MNKLLVYSTLIVVGLALLLVVAGRIGLLTGKRPADLGLQGGRLKPAPSTPNAVSSQADAGYHTIAPLAYTGDGRAAFARAVALVRAIPGATIVTEAPGYIHAECETRLLRFVDDLELALDETNGVIHVRSASRIGHGDLGANRARVEALRTAFAASR